MEIKFEMDVNQHRSFNSATPAKCVSKLKCIMCGKYKITPGVTHLIMTGIIENQEDGWHKTFESKDAELGMCICNNCIKKVAKHYYR